MKKSWEIFLNAVPVLLMIGLIPLVADDYILTLLDIVIIVISLFVKHEKKDLTLFVYGFVFMILSESIFISTGVETFIRNSFFGLMPVWLPFLWGYGFIAIKRLLVVLDR